jgi:alkylation response protein AidB-like acyl-CoA dehydrogenase
VEFDLTETQALFKQSAREFFARECPPQMVREMIESGETFSGALWQKLAEQGWTGLIFPEDVGGLGLSAVEMAIAFEEMGRALAPSPFLSTVPLAGSIIDMAGSAEQRQKYLRPICEGRARATLALLEESASWEPASVRLAANSDGGILRLNGKKLFVTDAASADFLLLAAREREDLLLLLVAAQAQGVRIDPMPAMDASRPIYEVSLDDVKHAEVLARSETAARALARGLDLATMCVSAEMVGMMQWVLDTSVEYAKTRKQFGRPIGQFQAVQHHCSNMLLLTESARSAVYYAAWAIGAEPERAPLAVSIAKAYASDACREVCNLGIQVHGGIGFTWDHDIHFYYKRAKADELIFGDATFHRERIARLVIDGKGDSHCGLPCGSGAWENLARQHL